MEEKNKEKKKGSAVGLTEFRFYLVYIHLDSTSLVFLCVGINPICVSV